MKLVERVGCELELGSVDGEREDGRFGGEAFEEDVADCFIEDDADSAKGVPLLIVSLVLFPSHGK